MRKRILEFRKRIDALLKDGGEQDWETVRREQLVQIAFFQHERLVHLIVTVLFALIEFAAAALTALSFTPAAFALCLAVLILLIPYVGHYYILENEVQKLYAQYDRIELECEKRRGTAK